MNELSARRLAVDDALARIDALADLLIDCAPCGTTFFHKQH